MLLAFDAEQSGHWSMHLLTSDVVSLSLSTVTAETSKIRKVPLKQCSHSHIALDLCAKKDSLFKQFFHAITDFKLLQKGCCNNEFI